MGAGSFGLETVDALFAAKRSCDGRNLRVVAIVADANCDPTAEIDTLEVFEKAVHEVLTRLLAVGDNIDPGILLLLQRQQCRAALCLNERASPSSCQGAHNMRGLANQLGFGRLPAIVVSSISQCPFPQPPKCYLQSASGQIGGRARGCETPRYTVCGTSCKANCLRASRASHFLAQHGD